VAAKPISPKLGKIFAEFLYEMIKEFREDYRFVAAASKYSPSVRPMTAPAYTAIMMLPVLSSRAAPPRR
jgi:hypothetical protein